MVRLASLVLRLASVLVPVAGNVLAVCVWVPLLAVPDGAVIRPMALAALAFLVASAAFLLGVPAGVASVSSPTLSLFNNAASVCPWMSFMAKNGLPSSSRPIS